jgi:hypothetical protein
MPDAAQLAQAHWNETPLFFTEEERYSSIQKYQCAPFQFLASWFGWFLGVRGQKN